MVSVGLCARCPKSRRLYFRGHLRLHAQDRRRGLRLLRADVEAGPGRERGQGEQRAAVGGREEEEEDEEENGAVASVG